MADSALTVQSLEDGTKHLFYKFIKIESASETIEVDCTTAHLMTFNIADFGESYENLVGRSFELSPLDCNNLSNIKLKGVSKHEVEYTEEQNQIWKEYTADKIGTNHFYTQNGTTVDNAWWPDAVANFGKPIKIYNQGPTVSSIENLRNIFYYLYSYDGNRSLFHRKRFNTTLNIPLFDLSTFDTSKLEIESTDRYSGTFGPSGRGGGYNSTSLKTFLATPEKQGNMGSDTYSPILFQNSITNIYKYFDFPDTANILDCSGWFYGQSNMVEGPRLPNSTLSMGYTYYGCSTLTSIKNIPTNVVSLTSAFENCVSLKSLGYKIPASVRYLSRTFAGSGIDNLPIMEDGVFKKQIWNTFENCQSLTTLDLNNLLEVSDIIVIPFFYCRNIKIIKDLTLDLTKSGKHLANLFYSSSSDVNVGVVNIEGLTNTSLDSSNVISTICKRDMSSGYLFGTGGGFFGIGSSISFVKAFPYYLLNVGTNELNAPKSTGFNYWVDYYSGSNDYIHEITRREVDKLELTLRTYKLEGDFTIKNINKPLLKVNPDYPYDFEIDSVEIENIYTNGSITYTGPGRCTNYFVDPVINSKGVLESVSFTGLTKLTDASKFDGPYTQIVLKYKAFIDGYPFHGRTNIKLYSSLDIVQAEYIEVVATTEGN